MVRTYCRKTERGCYRSQSLSAALEAVKSGTSLKAAARSFGIPPKTLRRHRDMKVATPGKSKLGSKSTVFTPEYEALLVEHIKQMEKVFFGLTTIDICRLAFELAVQLKISHPFQNASAGLDWLKGFLKRHPSLTIRTPEATSVSRAVGFNRPQVSKFYEVYKEVLDSTHVDALKVWNMDETGVSNVHKPVNIIATKGARSVGKITSGERGKTVTVICAMNAAGTFVPPTFIYARKRMVQSLMNGAPAGALGLCSPSGWTDGDIFLRWLEHFAAFANCSKESPQMLLLDGHHSHKTLKAVLYAREKGIVLITFPPHCTHRLQPLDVTFFKALKSAYNLESGNWMTSNPGRRISAFEVAGIFAAAYNRSASLQKAVAGFEFCGLWPYNPNRFTDDDFAPSMVTDEPMAVQSADFAVATTSDDPAAIVLVTSENVHGQLNNSSAFQNFSSDGKIHDSLSAVEIVSRSSEIIADTTVCSSSQCDVFTFQATLQQLSPQPRISCQRPRKRKAESATNLTSSPYKNMLMEKASAKTTGSHVRKIQITTPSTKQNSKSKLSKKTKKQGEKVKKRKLTCREDKKRSSKSCNIVNQHNRRKTEQTEAKLSHVMPGTSAVKNHLENICGYCGFEYGEDDDPLYEDSWLLCTKCSHWCHESCGTNCHNNFFCAKCE